MKQAAQGVPRSCIQLAILRRPHLLRREIAQVVHLQPPPCTWPLVPAHALLRKPSGLFRPQTDRPELRPDLFQVCSKLADALQIKALLQLSSIVLLLLGAVLEDTDSLLWSRCASSKCKQRLRGMLTGCLPGLAGTGRCSLAPACSPAACSMHCQTALAQRLQSSAAASTRRCWGAGGSSKPPAASGIADDACRARRVLGAAPSGGGGSASWHCSATQLCNARGQLRRGQATRCRADGCLAAHCAVSAAHSGAARPQRCRRGAQARQTACLCLAAPQAPGASAEAAALDELACAAAGKTGIGVPKQRSSGQGLPSGKALFGNGATHREPARTAACSDRLPLQRPGSARGAQALLDSEATQPTGAVGAGSAPCPDSSGAAEASAQPSLVASASLSPAELNERRQDECALIGEGLCAGVAVAGCHILGGGPRTCHIA